jgi:hypothetical protein
VGPCVQILVATEHVDGVSHRVTQGLPPVFQAFDTAWFRHATGTVTHHVEVTTLSGGPQAPQQGGVGGPLPVGN